MTVSLNRSYSGFPAGTVTTFNASTEAALIAQNLANATTATPSTGNVTSNEHNGRVAFAAAATSVVVTNPNVTASSKVAARINQATPDTTMTATRVVPAAGLFTIYANSAATATTVVDWEIVSTGLTPNQ